MQKIIQDTLNQAEALKSIQVSFDNEAAKNSLDAVIEAMRVRAQANPVHVPVIAVTGSLPEAVPGFDDLPKRARGGAIYGPGTNTSDSILARLSRGEHVLTAREVTAAGGHGAIYQLRRMILAGNIPGFANGGAISRIPVPSMPSMSADSGASGTTINLTIPGVGTYRMQAPRDVATSLQRDLEIEAIKFGGIGR